MWSCADVLVSKETGKFAGDVASEYLIQMKFIFLVLFHCCMFATAVQNVVLPACTNV